VAPEDKYRFKLRDYVATEAGKTTYIERFVLLGAKRLTGLKQKY
jgi:hypothetical protein